MIGQEIVYSKLKELNVNYEYFESPKDYETEDDRSFFDKINAIRCKNLFLRNHKGNQHYLVISKFYSEFKVKIIEDHFKKGKISFASEKRMDKWIKTKPGAVSLFSLFNDTENHTHVFIDEELKQSEYLTFLPNMHNAILKISNSDFVKILEKSGNSWEYFKLR